MFSDLILLFAESDLYPAALPTAAKQATCLVAGTISRCGCSIYYH